MRRLLLVPVFLACAGSVTMAQDKKVKDSIHVKVFRLQLCDPEEVAPVLDQLLERGPMDPDAGILPIGLPMGLPMGLGLLPMGLPPMGFPMIAPSPPEPPQLRVLTDIRAGAVIVRGREEDIQIAAEIISVLESPAGKPLPKTKFIEAISLTHAQASDMASLADGLDLPIRTVGLTDLKMVIGFGPDDMLRKWGRMVRDLDVPDRKLEMNKMRRLGVTGSNRAGAM